MTKRIFVEISQRWRLTHSAPGMSEGLVVGWRRYEHMSGYYGAAIPTTFFSAVIRTDHGETLMGRLIGGRWAHPEDWELVHLADPNLPNRSAPFSINPNPIAMTGQRYERATAFYKNGNDLIYSKYIIGIVADTHVHLHNEHPHLFGADNYTKCELSEGRLQPERWIYLNNGF